MASLLTYPFVVGTLYYFIILDYDTDVILTRQVSHQQQRLSRVDAHPSLALNDTSELFHPRRPLTAQPLCRHD